MQVKLNCLLGICILTSLFACSIDDDSGINPSPEDAYQWDLHEPFETDYNTFTMPVTDQFKPIPDEMGPVKISEASGLAWSYRNPGMIWTHNDSGNTNMLFLLNAETGEIVTTYRIGGTVNIDWEDIEVSYGPMEGETYIYLADTGDNNKRRPEYTIYRFPEPVFDTAHEGEIVTLNELEIDRIIFRFPDGSHDTEGMLVDPFTKDIFLATKRDVVSMLYVAPYPQTVEERFTLYKAGEFSFRETSAATCSLSGEKVLIKNRQEIFYWERNDGESMVEMLARTPIRAPYIGEPQGEAICFDPDYNYFTLSEALNSSNDPILYKYYYQPLN
ncbi:hypothetical protein [Pararhodonellum marinum]|uniref:hypothetical protein n=1 Tax=Pararhodonellum marinum TaxID=2755358 RepID=UPI00188E1DC2|nr:hypothetical protein [Pararhodonellum marinum]